MEKVNTRYRGGIYFVDAKAIQEEHSTTEGDVKFDNLPCVVVSNNLFNSTSDNVTIALIDKLEDIDECDDFSIPFIDYAGKKSMILCNSIHTVNKKYLTKVCYGVLSRSTLKELDKKLSCMLGITRNNVDISGLMEAINKLIEIKKEEIAYGKQPVTQRTVSEIIEKINKEFNKTDDIASEPTAEESGSATEKSESEADELCAKAEPTTDKTTADEAKSPKTPDKHEVPDGKAKYKSRGFWTQEKILEFMKDKETLPVAEVRKKWNISSNAVVYSTYSTFKKRLSRDKEQA